MVRLNVPIFGQPTVYYCIPACIKMVLEYAREKHGKKIPRLSIKKIAKIVGTTIEGTALGDVEKMNEVLRGAIPSVEFKAEFSSRFPEIIEELGEEKPVIVVINCAEPPDMVPHGVVVIGFEPETNTVFYNDPNGSVARAEEVGAFIEKWGVPARLVKVLIGERRQRTINEWATNSMGG